MNKIPALKDMDNVKDDRAHITIRAIKPAAAARWESMRTALRPDGAEDHGLEIMLFLSGYVSKDLAAALVAETQSQAIHGFRELSARDDLPGLEGRRTGYVEGLYISQKSATAASHGSCSGIAGLGAATSCAKRLLVFAQPAGH